jgi:hypothetical protein
MFAIHNYSCNFQEYILYLQEIFGYIIEHPLKRQSK